MPFNSGSDVEARLRDPANLTSREVRDLMPWVIGERRLTAELALWNLEAVQRFERSSNKLTKYLAWVTVALVLLTVAIAYYSFVLAKLALDGTESFIPPGLVHS
jgi:hypothetical protein